MLSRMVWKVNEHMTDRGQIIRNLYARGMEPYEIYDVLRKRGEEVELDEIFKELSRLASPSHYEPKSIFLSRWFFLRAYFLSGMGILVDLLKKYEKEKKEKSVVAVETAKMCVDVIRDLVSRLKNMWGACRHAQFDVESGEYEVLPRDVAEIFSLQAKGLTLSQIADVLGRSEEELERMLVEALKRHRLVKSFYVATLDSMASELKKIIYQAAELFRGYYREILSLRSLLNELDSFVYDVRRAVQRRGGIRVAVKYSSFPEKEESRGEKYASRLFELFGERVRVLSEEPLRFEVDVRGTAWTPERLLDVVVRNLGVLGVVVEARKGVLRFEERKEGFAFPNQLGEVVKRVIIPFADFIEEIRTAYPKEIFPEAVRDRVVGMRGNKLHTKILLRGEEKVINEVKRLLSDLEEVEVYGRTIMLFTIGV